MLGTKWDMLFGVKFIAIYSELPGTNLSNSGLCVSLFDGEENDSD